MSHLLWKYFWENDIERFRALLAPYDTNLDVATGSTQAEGKSRYMSSSPSSLSPCPSSLKSRRLSVSYSDHGKTRSKVTNFGREEINRRDHVGLTILHRAASSTLSNAWEFVEALLTHPTIDLHVQDLESGWNALHRALYNGNITIAQLLLAKERSNILDFSHSQIGKVGQLIKTKDHEGKSPFELFNSTVRSVPSNNLQDVKLECDSDDETSEPGSSSHDAIHAMWLSDDNDELFMFGSNKNLSLGVGDGDDRQYPERILIHRPEKLLHRFHKTRVRQCDPPQTPKIPNLDSIPTLIRHCPMTIQDVVLSKFHSAVVTTDPLMNLYICGIGRGGRLGLGDENTQFRFVPVEVPFADRKVQQVALGQNHSLAVTVDGELWSWGLNTDSQLGYVLPQPARASEEPMSLWPRQVFGTLKREPVQGIAASAIHSVCFSGSSLYCWGRNVGQLALMDADSRSLEKQQTPRKVAASLLTAPIKMVSAADHATICLLSNASVWVFTNYGYNLVKFPLPDVFANRLSAGNFTKTGLDSTRRDITYITAGDEMIAAVTARGEVFTMELNPSSNTKCDAGSTTNPAKIKGAVTRSKCIWESRTDGALTASIGDHGSLLICTRSGAVWKRVKRAHPSSPAKTTPSGNKKQDFKFERVPCITDGWSVRSSTFGSLAIVRRDRLHLAGRINVAAKSLWHDTSSLLCLKDFSAVDPNTDQTPFSKGWHAALERAGLAPVATAILRTSSIEEELPKWLEQNGSRYSTDLEMRTTTVPSLRVPCHSWLLAGRSSVLRRALFTFRRNGTSTYSDTFLMERTDGKILISLVGLDVYSLLNLIVFCYQDATIPVWKFLSDAPIHAYRFRQVRSEVMRIATILRLPQLEASARLQVGSKQSLDEDMASALCDPCFFSDGDILIQLGDANVTAHSNLLCQRCPFFEAMFRGRSRGRWLSNRRDPSHDTTSLTVDLKHIRSEVFQYVLKHLYCDNGEEMFDNLTVPTLDELSDIVLDVLAAADELMLDRLSQVCQRLIGRFVTTRNIAQLMNELSSCAVPEFKRVGLEYICAELDCLLENHLLDNLDGDLLLDLDEVVRSNQSAHSPIARSGRAENLLHEKYPELAADIEEERRNRLRAMALRVAQLMEERRSSPPPPMITEVRNRQSISRSVVEETHSGTSSPNKSAFTNRPSKSAHATQPSKNYENRSLDYHGTEAGRRQIMQDTDASPCGKHSGSRSFKEPAFDPHSRRESNAGKAMLGDASDFSKISLLRRPDGPWAQPSQNLRSDLKGIMLEASTPPKPGGSRIGRFAPAAGSSDLSKTPAKMSQKERKKKLQENTQASASNQTTATTATATLGLSAIARSPAPSAWRTAAPVHISRFDPAASGQKGAQDATLIDAKPVMDTAAAAHLRQRRTASPDTRFPGQSRYTSMGAGSTSADARIRSASHDGPLTPHSKTYITRTARTEIVVGSSLKEIIGEQQLEERLVRAAVEKKSLQEIQEEQAFQEWWDQESRRAQEDEARKIKRGPDRASPRLRRGRRRRGDARQDAGQRDSAEQGDNTPSSASGTGRKGKSKGAG